MDSLVSRNKSFVNRKLGKWNEIIELFTKICMMEEPVWMAKKETLPRMIEFYLMDALREGLSQHLAGNTPCNFITLDKLIAVFQFALGQNHIIATERLINTQEITGTKI